jgi:hypothetical protein
MTEAPAVGLCATCLHSRIIRSDRGSVFYRCERSLTDSSFPKYPRLPVVACSGYEPTPQPHSGSAETG